MSDADLCTRRDFPGAVVGVSYNPRAAEERRRETLARLGVTEQAVVIYQPKEES